MITTQERDTTAKGMSAALQEALHRGVLRRLPLTFLPFVNQQLRQWEFLFPNERGAVERLLVYVAGRSAEQSATLFRDVVELEAKMGVRHWQFSTAEQTIQNSSQLARSPYFQQWRQAVQMVFDAADRSASQNGPAGDRKRLILIDIPASLPLDAKKVWRRWQGIGRPVELDVLRHGGAPRMMEWLLAGGLSDDGLAQEGLFSVMRGRTDASASDVWVVDASSGLVETLAKRREAGILLSYSRLDAYRENFSHEMNTMRKDLADADAVFDHLRKVDVRPWCPPEVVADPAVWEFVRSLYLSGNGAGIFSNSFVEWGASEALRRARPRFLAARFGIRSKPKPFTGVAVFENPDKVNPMPAVDDVEGSALDAEMLALYVWLAASRYEEYQRNTVCVCLAESIAQAYVVGPAEFSLDNGSTPVSMERLSRALAQWIA
jgi:hypothetical protein